MQFDWDAVKDAANRRKHGVSSEEAATVFGDPLALVGPDVHHGAVEHRERVMGRSEKGRLIVVIFTRRAERFRIISARGTSGAEARAYETKIKDFLKTQQ